MNGRNEDEGEEVAVEGNHPAVTVEGIRLWSYEGNDFLKGWLKLDESSKQKKNVVQERIIKTRMGEEGDGGSKRSIRHSRGP